MAKNFYAVKKGLTPGIYLTWPECEANVKGFPGAIYKGFNTKREAEEFLGIAAPIMSDESIIKKRPDKTTDEIVKIKKVPTNKPYAFVDGSFNKNTRTYGYGGFVYDGHIHHIVQGSGTDKEMASMRNVAGEVFGSMAAIQKAIDLGLKEITIYYDYLGIEMWATGKWKRNKKGTIAYYDYFQSCKDEIEVHFKKVKAHTGVAGNEIADRLAKQAVGI